MRRVQLGRTDLAVSRICFGCWQLSPRFWGDIPLGPWEAALRRALDLGVNFIDTADAYGDGLAERALGAFLKREKCRDRFIIATKFGWNFETKFRFPDTRPEHIMKACEDSLARLQTDRVDLYQIHFFDILTRPEEVAAAFLRLKKEGKVRWFGVSNMSPEQMRLYRAHMDVHCLQAPYNLLTRDVEQSELPYCMAERLGVMAYSPLHRGLLTGKYARDQAFADFRKDVSLFRGHPFERIMNGLDQLKPMAGRHGLSLGQFAVRWVLSHPAVTSAIVGVKAPEHIEGIVAAADGELPCEDWYRAAEIMAQARQEALAPPS